MRRRRDLSANHSRGADADERNHSRGADAPELCNHQARKRLPESAPRQKREAERRKAHPTMAVSMRDTAARSFGARSPSGAPPRHLQRRIASLRSGPRFLELPGTNGRTLPGASAASTSPPPYPPPRAGEGRVGMPAETMPGAARERRVWRRPREPPPLRLSGAPSRKASLDDSMSRMMLCNI